MTKQLGYILEKKQQKEKQLQEEEFSLKEKIIYSITAFGIAVGSFFIGRKIIKKTISNSEEKKTFEEGSSATLAKGIKMAFDNDGYWGTDTEALRNVLRQVPSKEEWNKVVKSYQKLYSSNVLKDMSDELQTTEYNEMLQIISAKPERYTQGQVIPKDYDSWAKRLKSAFDKSYSFIPGTDEDAIKAVFTEIPTQADFVETGKAYFKLYNNTLIDDLKSELEIWEYSDYMKIITSKPQA